jgi:hypothetical protein
LTTGERQCFVDDGSRSQVLAIGHARRKPITNKLAAGCRASQVMEEWAGVGDDVFQCRCVRDSSDPDASAWLFIYYKALGVFRLDRESRKWER